MKTKWKRDGFGWQSLVLAENKIAFVRQMDQCKRWFPYLGEDADFPDGEAFKTMWEAKIYVEEEITRGRLGKMEAEAVRNMIEDRGN